VKRGACLLLLHVLLAAPVQAASPPDWLAAAIRRSVPPGTASARSVVLLKEQRVKVPRQGRIVTTTRLALRVLAPAGLVDASARADYTVGTSKVRSLKAWALSSAGTVVRSWTLEDAEDGCTLDAGQLYSELRWRTLADPLARVGEVFGFEAIVEEDALFAEWRWTFCSSVPVALSRFRLELPPGLTVRTRTANLDSTTVEHDGDAWTWEMHDLAGFQYEALAPSRADLAATLWVQALPTLSERSPAGLSLRDWMAASRWFVELTTTPSAITPEVADRARVLAGAATDTLERIRVLARYVQGLNYVAVDLNRGRGWGYRPHEAATVLRAGYGDCKDKANLLCALLRAQGIESWLLLLNVDARDALDTTCVSPFEFNHCITAILAPGSFRGISIDDGPTQRLIGFDPTDPLTLFGDLPAVEQGAWGLLIRDGSALVRLPVQPPEENRLSRRIDAELDSDGRLRALMVERSAGQAARDVRELRRGLTNSEFERQLETLLPRQGGSIVLRSWAVEEDSLTGRQKLTVSFDSPAFARLVADRLLAFRGALASLRTTWVLTDTTRTMPIALPAAWEDETLTVKLPQGYVLDERPSDLRVANDLGRLESSWVERDGALVMTRCWQLRPVTVPASRWSDVRSLYAALRATNEATVVLVRREAASRAH
jgi:hypothetical protein